MITSETIQYLKDCGKDICEANECTEDEHNCESYAYFDSNFNLLDVCTSDYFQGCSGLSAAISISREFNMTVDELVEEIEEQTYNDEIDNIYI